MKKLIFITLFLNAVSSNVFAALGLPENTARFGYSLGVGRFDISDPDGRTQPAYAVQPLKLIYTDWQKNGNRLWVELLYNDVALEADEHNIGQHVLHRGVNFMLQKNFVVSPYIKPWMSAGVGISVVGYEQRHTMDSEGYLLELLPNRESATASALFSIANEWQVSKEWTVGTSFLQRFSVNDAIFESSMFGYFLVRY